jgi:site-specific recombinase XerD
MAQSQTLLDKDVERYKKAAYADSTKAAYRCQLKKYLNFCKSYGVQSIPVSSQTLCRYVAFLAQNMRPSSIKQYLNVIRVLHWLYFSLSHQS